MWGMDRSEYFPSHIPVVESHSSRTFSQRNLQESGRIVVEILNNVQIKVGFFSPLQPF